MAKQSILIIEDDRDIVELLSHNLAREGFDVHEARDGETGLALARRHKPSLILLDLMLPGIQGLEVCRQLKQREDSRVTPLIIVTAKGDESDVVVGLELGADDYLVKPFSIKELIARVRAVLRRLQPGPQPDRQADCIRLGSLVIDSVRHEVRVDGQRLALTLTEFRVLTVLASRPGQVFTRDQLLEKISDGDSFVIDRNIDVHIRSIRQKLESHRDLILTVRGVGYKLRETEATD
ncbi:MAG: DNA-binding response regulator [Acidobacteria bacterium]|nr:MAG: DNA-binding response regulator [Acidobacteriota bacterium]